jgi:ATP-dependent helicase/nuclease subunit A
MSQLSFDLGPKAAPDERPAAGGPFVPPDQAERDRIRTELDANLLVEAGAGSGKTTSMVDRMVAMVRAGREVDRIAAVTFTRKAAAELRERFQEALESAYRTAVRDGDEEGRVRFGTALDAIDRCFLGTIHAFCARLLRDRPLEAGVPPEFVEVSGPDEDRLRTESWTRFLDRVAARPGSRLMKQLAAHGLRPAHLVDVFREIADNPDVRFPAPPAPTPDPAALASVRQRLERLMDASERLFPAEEHPRGADKLQTKIRGLRFRRWVAGWRRDLDFFCALEDAVQGSNDVTQNRWSDDPAVKREAKELGARWEEFCAEGGAARQLLEPWWARRYRVAIRFARAAAADYAADRVRAGKLTFQDLLVRATALLRNHPAARAELGERYRWLLVDEFQDTDPVQAEMLLLLASDPAADPAGAANPAGATDPDEAADPDRPGQPAVPERPLWLRVAPRPGALFVVGDPKQSIYRFRRADIAVYNQVKRRFREFGDILHLVTNFRSRRPIEAFVNRAFEGRFPAQETDHQAAFAPLRVRPDRRSPTEGVYWYPFHPAPGGGALSGRRIAEAEAGLVASWIRDRVERGERRAGDFLVLAARKAQLATYARALEGHGIPVQVSGGGVGAEHELTELVLLLRALADPDDAALTLAALEGLFFGLSHQELWDHVRAGGRISFLADPARQASPDRPDGGSASADPSASARPAADALAMLREFWQIARRLPADVAVATIADRLGILPWAAAGELGSTRAGAVMYAMDALRVAARTGAASLHEAIEILDAALAQEDVDAPLVPGETDAVRVMNLHKAKGLEAPVVMLVYPAAPFAHTVDRHIARVGDGEAVGWLQVLDPGQRGGRVIARPATWPDHEAAELPFQAAEEVRRLYVAATRAEDELVIARCDGTGTSSFWADLHPALDTVGLSSEVRLVERRPPERETLETPPEVLAGRIDDAARATAGLAEPSYRALAITHRVHGSGPGAAHKDPAGPEPPELPDTEVLYLNDPALLPPDAPPPEPRGREWGSAVHRALEAAARGAEGAVLRAVCRDALVEFERPADPGTGEPAELDELVALVETMRAQPVWERVAGARRVLVEAPFSFAVPADEAARLGIADPAAVELLDGTIDLAIQDPDGRWTVIDFKTDARPDPAKKRLYERQTLLYAHALARAGATGPRNG